MPNNFTITFQGSISKIMTTEITFQQWILVRFCSPSNTSAVHPQSRRTVSNKLIGNGSSTIQRSRPGNHEHAHLRQRWYYIHNTVTEAVSGSYLHGTRVTLHFCHKRQKFKSNLLRSITAIIRYRSCACCDHLLQFRIGDTWIGRLSGYNKIPKSSNI